jgi:hypothetical protein
MKNALKIVLNLIRRCNQQFQNPQIGSEERKQLFDLFLFLIGMSYCVKIGIGTTSAIFTLVSIVLFYNGYISQAHLEIGICAVSSIVGFKAARDDINQLERILKYYQVTN